MREASTGVWAWKVVEQNNKCRENSDLASVESVAHSSAAKPMECRGYMQSTFAQTFLQMVNGLSPQPKNGVMHGRRNGSGRPGGCRTNNLTSKNFYVHIISIFENVS